MADINITMFRVERIFSIVITVCIGRCYNNKCKICIRTVAGLFAQVRNTGHTLHDRPRDQPYAIKNKALRGMKVARLFIDAFLMKVCFSFVFLINVFLFSNCLCGNYSLTENYHFNIFRKVLTIDIKYLHFFFACYNKILAYHHLTMQSED